MCFCIVITSFFNQNLRFYNLKIITIKLHVHRFVQTTLLLSVFIGFIPINILPSQRTCNVQNANLKVGSLNIKKYTNFCIIHYSVIVFLIFVFVNHFQHTEQKKTLFYKYTKIVVICLLILSYIFAIF